MAGIPDEVRALAEFAAAEDLCLALLRPELPGIEVSTLIAADQTFPLVLIRRVDQFGIWSGDPRFIDTASIAAHCFVEDPDGDADAEVLSQAVRTVLYQSVNKVVPGLGHITSVDMTSSPKRASDWATASGPVQYADLPSGVHRYETRFDITFRKPNT